ncbi:MAG: helix-hairpin-helix domain-containing protein [Bacteroidia bacterium]|jgi:DNA uptake protein ComE-like DNA-binding protein|nr:helix-hairpin-helix domain-containing protein [Bacteroidia bacterium]
MIKRKIETLSKSYFYFSQTERKGILWLLGILFCLLFFPLAYEYLFPPQPLDINQTSIESISYHEPAYDAKGRNTLFTFDPNTVSLNQLLQLGLSTKQANAIVHYREKGGKFKVRADFAKIYGLTNKQKEQLLPFVDLPEKDVTLPSDSTKKRIQYPIDLNHADSATLVALYRIGPAMASRIITYRTKLGGFVSLNQLTEIYGFDEDILYDLEGKIKVNAADATRYDVNTVTSDQLKTHPYFKYKLSNAIVQYRNQHGSYKELADLKKIAIVNDSIFLNITRYLFVK